MTQNTQQLATLKNKLQMPLIVRDYLVTDTSLPSDANYALNEIMSNFLPSDAILSAAFTMKEVANSQSIISTDMQYLHMECDRIIERYSDRDALSQENPELWAQSENEMLSDTCEDINDFLDLVSLCYMSFEIINPKVNDIISIINTQLQAQIFIIDELLEMQKNINISPTKQMPSISGIQAENVVMFPV